MACSQRLTVQGFTAELVEWKFAACTLVDGDVYLVDWLCRLWSHYWASIVSSVVISGTIKYLLSCIFGWHKLLDFASCTVDSGSELISAINKKKCKIGGIRLIEKKCESWTQYQIKNPKYWQPVYLMVSNPYYHSPHFDLKSWTINDISTKNASEACKRGNKLLIM